MSQSSTITFRLDEASLAACVQQVGKSVDDVKEPVLMAMGNEVHRIIEANFGQTGEDRPWPWVKLSEEYAKRMGRKYATLHVTGALKAALLPVEMVNGGAEIGMDSSALPYVNVHHYGNPDGNRTHPGTPARRVMPLKDDGSVTNYTIEQVMQAAQIALQRALNS